MGVRGAVCCCGAPPPAPLPPRLLRRRLLPPCRGLSPAPGLSAFSGMAVFSGLAGLSAFTGFSPRFSGAAASGFLRSRPPRLLRRRFSPSSDLAAGAGVKSLMKLMEGISSSLSGST